MRSGPTGSAKMDPLSLLCRLATAVPPPRYHQVKYAGVLAPASPWRKRIAPKQKPEALRAESTAESEGPKSWSGYRPWAELLKRTFRIDVMHCEQCGGPMVLKAMLTEPKSVARYLTKLGEPCVSGGFGGSEGVLGPRPCGFTGRMPFFFLRPAGRRGVSGRDEAEATARAVGRFNDAVVPELEREEQSG